MILVVDDEPEIVELVALNLEASGAKVYSAHDGLEAYEVFSKHPEIEIVVTDIRMPGEGGDGISLIKRIRSSHPKFPFVIVVSGFSKNSEDELRSAGANHVFGKPLRFDELRSTIASLKE